MIALSFEGQALIDRHRMLGFYNREASVRSIREAIDFLYLGKNELARKSVYQALELIRDSARCVFIVCPGLVSMVANERNDCENHKLLSEIRDKLQRIYSNCWKLLVFEYSSNVINFQVYREYRSSRVGIVTGLTHVVCLLLEYEKKQVNL